MSKAQQASLLQMCKRQKASHLQVVALEAGIQIVHNFGLLLADAVSTANTSSDAPDVADSARAQSSSLDATNDSVLSKEPSLDQMAVEGFQEVQQSAVVTEAYSQPQPSKILHVCLGPLPSAHISCTAFYFLRSQPGKLTATTDLDSLDCGLLSEGPSIQMLHQVHVVK